MGESGSLIRSHELGESQGWFNLWFARFVFFSAIRILRITVERIRRIGQILWIHKLIFAQFAWIGWIFICLFVIFVRFAERITSLQSESRIKLSRSCDSPDSQVRISANRTNLNARFAHRYKKVYRPALAIPVKCVHEECKRITS